MSERKRILVVIDWFLPGFKAGGQIRSCLNLIRRMHAGYEFDIFTSDRDFGDTVPYTGIAADTWHRHEDGFRVFYASPATVSRHFLHTMKEGNYAVVYFNSLFSWRFTTLPLLLLRFSRLKAHVVLAPRGMLGAGALAIKRLKKMTFLRMARLLALYNNITWHATSPQEVDEIRKTMGSHARVVMAEDTGTADNGTYYPIAKEPGSLRVVFLSRISPKKNLLLALDALAGVSPAARIQFTICGPVEDRAYWDTCAARIARLPAHIVVEVKEEVQPDAVPALFSAHHLFFFPTQHENFGHVIHESLLASCPVLISDQTPWKGLEAGKAGISLPLSGTKAFISRLEEFVSLDQAGYDNWRKGALAYARTHNQNPELEANYRKLFD